MKNHFVNEMSDQKNRYNKKIIYYITREKTKTLNKYCESNRIRNYNRIESYLEIDFCLVFCFVFSTHISFISINSSKKSEKNFFSIIFDVIFFDRNLILTLYITLFYF